MFVLLICNSLCGAVFFFFFFLFPFLVFLWLACFAEVFKSMIVSWNSFGLWPFKYVSKLGIRILISIFYATLYGIFSFLLCILGTELFLTHKLEGFNTHTLLYKGTSTSSSCDVLVLLEKQKEVC